MRGEYTLPLTLTLAEERGKGRKLKGEERASDSASMAVQANTVKANLGVVEEER